MTNDEQRTCGKGLAENSALPARIGNVMNAMADLFEAHLRAIDSKDESSKPEHEAYQRLSQEHREIAGKLLATAEAMNDYRELPMARHDMEAMSGQREPFEGLVEHKRRLLALLQETAPAEQELLDAMKK